MTIFTYFDDVRKTSSSLGVKESDEVIETNLTNHNYIIFFQTSNVEHLLDYLTAIGDLPRIRQILRKYL